MLQILRQKLQNTFLPELYSHSHNTGIREGDVQCRMSYMRSQHSYYISRTSSYQTAALLGIKH